jgi:5-methylcytosine-specific restriction endonuclease McrA
MQNSEAPWEHVIVGCICTGKRCPRCGHTKCRGAFNRSKATKDGLQSYCRQCRKEHHEENRDSEVARSKRYYQGHRESYKTYDKAYRADHPELSKSVHKAYRARHRDNSEYQARVRANNKASRNRHPEYYQRYREANRSQYRAYNKAYRKDNHAYFASREAARRARLRHSGGAYTQREWSELKARYDYTCLCCGKREPEITLSPDHVIPVSKGGANTINNIQPLCLSCNRQKNARIIDYRKERNGI